MALSEAELSSFIQQEEADTIGFMGSSLTEQRRKALKYYLGEPFGNEQDGRSQVVSTEVADTIEWIMPSLMRVFASGDQVVVFEPVGEEDVEAAKQATDYVNYVFDKRNDGFKILYTWFKDALLQKNGVVKVWWEEKEADEEHRGNFTQDSLTILQADPDTEIVSQEPGQPMLNPLDGSQVPTFDVTYRQTKTAGRVKIVGVPPEEFLISRRAAEIDEAVYVAHRVRKKLSDLIAEGFDKADVMSLSGDDDADLTEEAITRRSFDDDEGGNGLLIDRPGVLREVWVKENYVLVDWDDDGIAERRQIITAGDGNKILKREGKSANVKWDGPVPLVALTPILMPHRFFGMSVADLVMDLQLIKSTVLRQILDNLYLTNNPGKIVSDQVNLDDLLTVRPGRLVRLKDGAMPGDGHVMPDTVQFTAGAAFPMLEYLDALKENRVGVTKYNQGLDANSLNKTATGIANIMNASQQRIELIARVFAETGVKTLFRIILQLVTKHQSEPQQIRLRGKFVAVDPSEWDKQFDTSVTVGLGTGNKDQMLMHIQTLLTVQQTLVQFQKGLSGPLVTADKIYNSLEKLVQNAALGSVEHFFTDPSDPKTQQMMQQNPPPPDPAMVKAQNDAQIAQQKLVADQQLNQQKLQADLQKAEQQFQLDQAKIAAEMQMKREQMAVDHQLNQEKMRGDMAMQGQKMQADHALALKKQEGDLQVKRDQAAASAKPPVNLSFDGGGTGITDATGQMMQAMQAMLEKIDQRDDKQDQRIKALTEQLAAASAPRAKRITGNIGGRPFEAMSE